MTRVLRGDSRVSRSALMALLSAALHLVLFLVLVYSGGRFDGMHAGQTAVSHLVLIEGRDVERREGVDAPVLIPTVAIESADTLQLSREPPSVLMGDVQLEPPLEPLVATQVEPLIVESLDAPAPFAMTEAARSTLLQQLAVTAEALTDAPHAHVSWSQDSTQYSAVLVVQRAQDGSGLDRVTAEVSAEDHGRQIITHIKLKRMAFSNYAQLIDRWDPMVQLHDDEVDGRMHINSRFNLMYDSRTAPKLLGKVTTSARSFNAESRSSRREREIFRGGIETRAGRITFPDRLQSFAATSRDENARIHECAHDTRIRFFPDGSYTWRDLETDVSRYVPASMPQPIYFIAGRGTTLYVKGIISGDVLIYSPNRIVIEGNLTYARDPRHVSASHDYLGLVSDGYVQVAPAHVTGRGDLNIHAAIFAGRRFTVTDIDHPRAGTLRIFGSLTAGTLSATEPRYATKLEYDDRFEKRRPRGFPTTNRFALEEWDQKWITTPPSATPPLAANSEPED